MTAVPSISTSHDGRASAVTQNADFNSDGLVDGQDLLVWQRGLGVGTVLAAGDANGDGWPDLFVSGHYNGRARLWLSPRPSCRPC